MSTVSTLFDRVRDALADRYRLDREIGRGGMATVYLAHDLKHDRPVAIKVFRPDVAAQIGIDRFLREIAIAARLQHPHILPLHDSGRTGGPADRRTGAPPDEFLYYVMPYVAGESLADRLAREGPLPVETAIEIATEVASALDYAHDQHIVHRDIKPANILLSGGHAVVADFGIARAVSAAQDTRITLDGMAVGTPAYMSPEQAMGDTGEMDAPADIYSLGCVLYEMLTGSPPHGGRTTQAIFAQIVTGDVPDVRERRPEVPRSVARAVAVSLARRPSERFATAGAVARALHDERALPRRRWTRRRVAAVAAALAVLILVAWWLVPNRLGSVVAADAQVIAIVPFTTSGSNVEVLGEGMVDLLATNLDGVGGIRTVDPRTVLRRWRQRARGGSVDLAGSLAIGRELDAGSVLTGSIVEAGPEVRLTGELRAVNGDRLAQVSADGPADSVLALVDTLSLRMLREIWRSRQPIPDLRVSALTTGSLAAIRAHLQGEQYYRRSQWDSAAAAFGDAIAADPTFALSLIRMAQSLSWLRGHGTAQAIRLGDAAAEFADRLPPRERSLVVANQLFQEGRLAALDSLRAYVARYSDDAEGWYQFGDVQYRARYLLALAPQDLYAPFDRVFGLDSTLAPALIHPVELALEELDSVRVTRYAAQLGRAAVSRESESVERARRLLWGSADSIVARVAAQATAPTYDPIGEALDLVQALLSTSRTRGVAVVHAALAALDTLVALTPTQDQHEAEILALAVRVRASLGRFADAAPLVARLDAIAPGAARSAAFLAVGAGTAPAWWADSALERLTAARPLDRREELEVLYWRAVAALARADFPAARRLAAVGREDAGAGQREPFQDLFAALLGWADVVAGDTARGVARLREGLDDAGYWPWVTEAAAPLRLALARALAARNPTRDEGLRHLRYAVAPTDVECIPLALAAEARAREAAGESAQAIAAYRAFSEWWAAGDLATDPRRIEAVARVEVAEGQ
jgi:serine/threonine-protein kinase